jgi:hypothetical protein
MPCHRRSDSRAQPGGCATPRWGAAADDTGSRWSSRDDDFPAQQAAADSRWLAELFGPAAAGSADATFCGRGFSPRRLAMTRGPVGHDGTLIDSAEYH